jgi:hypothetical protein
MKTLKHFALLVSLLIVPAFAQDNALSGNWKIDGDVAGNAVEGTCTMTQDGKKLTGVCVLGSLAQRFEITGEVVEKKVNWKFSSEHSGQALTTTFSGKLDEAGTKLSGDIDVQPISMSGNFVAKKVDTKKE